MVTRYELTYTMVGTLSTRSIKLFLAHQGAKRRVHPGH